MSETSLPPEPAPTPPPAAVTQEQIDKLMGRARSEGKSTATREMLDELGVDDIDAVKAVITAHQERVDADKTEVDRAKDEAVQAKREAEQARAETAQAQLSVRVDRALVEANVETNALSHIAELIKVDPSATDDEIREAIDTLKGDIPQMFAEPDGAPGTPSWAPKGGTGEKSKKTAGKTGMDAGAERFASMKGQP